MKGLVDGFKQDHNSLREEMRKREERLRKEADEVKKKYLKLVEEVNKQRESEGSGMNEVKRLKEEAEEARRKVEEGLRVEIQKLREEVDRSAREDNGAVQTAKCASSYSIPSSFVDKHRDDIGTSRTSWLVCVA